MSNVDAQFPRKLGFLFKPHRYKCAHGGRGSGKSWGVARALLILGAQRKLRILCTREVQKSIKDSVHKLLSDQITALGLTHKYEILETQIRGKNGTEIFFAGLSNQTADSIKSYEGVDICWIEEGQTISKRSWGILRPTIRKDGSEIWVTFNPELETDPTYEMLVANPPSDAKVVEMNWRDNPWFSAVLEQERQDCLRNYPRDYPNIWEGKCRPAVSGAIYYDEVTALEADGRLRDVPINPALPIHRVWDLGFSDLMAIVLVQRIVSEIAIVGYVTGQRRTLTDYLAQLNANPRYARSAWGIDYLPHDGFAQRHQTGKSDADVLRGLGCRVEETPHMTVEQGIRQARLVFPRVFIDKESVQSSGDEGLPGLIDCLKRYRRHMNMQTQTLGAPLHDVFSNGADAFRYVCINADRMPSSMDSTTNHAIFTNPAYHGYQPATAAGY
jgi:phage terminase large subunit